MLAINLAYLYLLRSVTLQLWQVVMARVSEGASGTTTNLGAPVRLTTHFLAGL
jgi:hypothetical protein